MEGLIDINPKEFRQIADLVYGRFGISLSEKKTVLVRGRLNSMIKGLGFTSFEDYYNHVISDSSGQALLSLVDKISTNHTYFFREADHFNVLIKAIIPEILSITGSKGYTDFRIWCAGCASGEEAYTLAMIAWEELMCRSGFSLPLILATDISLSALNTAARGVYPEERLKQMPDYYKKKYFKETEKGFYQVADKLKRAVLFKRLNLMNNVFPFKGKFDIVFCRNVMIYFDTETKDALIKKIGNYLRDWGYLFIGHSETLGRDNTGFRYVQPAVYKKNAIPGLKGA